MTPDGLDENYPFMMSKEDADRCYNIRKCDDGVVYFGIDQANYYHNNNGFTHLPTCRDDSRTMKNKDKKMKLYLSHTSSISDFDLKSMSLKTSRYIECC